MQIWLDMPKHSYSYFSFYTFIHFQLKCAFEHDKNIIPVFDPQFEWPGEEMLIPEDIRGITRFNGVQWVHEYQEACIDKLERFITGELSSRALMAGMRPNESRVSLISTPAVSGGRSATISAGVPPTRSAVWPQHPRAPQSGRFLPPGGPGSAGSSPNGSGVNLLTEWLIH